MTVEVVRNERYRGQLVQVELPMMYQRLLEVVPYENQFYLLEVSGLPSSKVSLWTALCSSSALAID